ncbi:putative membrane protein EpsK [Novipirellula aureliae]|uniref:Putative membrane protein EpsK n=1 Tax=Novipirellula aureliae TaxID=2527966 RepID=A0A5C6DVA2_9BACT|nr:hypothetical protein [Novipirellula aureliae]TWU41303.1 putative membrane protein EpsK [Novipirellula aureliae]
MTQTTNRVPVSKKLVSINALSALIAHACNFAILLWGNQYLLSHVSPAEMDLLPVVMGVVAFSPLMTTALTAGLGRYVVEAYSQSDDEKITRLVSSIVPVYLLVAMVLVAIMTVFCTLAPKLLNVASDHIADVRFMLVIVFLGMTLRLLATPFSVGLYVCQKQVLQNVILMGGALISAASMLWLMLGIGPQVKWFIVAQFAGTVFNVMATLIVSCRLLPSLRFRVDWIDFGSLKGMFAFNSWTLVRQTSASVRAGSIPFLLNAFAAPGQATAFYIGSLPDRQIKEVSSKIFSPLETPMIAMFATGNQTGLANAYLRGNRLMLWISMLAATPLMVFASETIDLYTHGTIPDAALVLFITMLILPIQMANGMLGPLVHAHARPDALAKTMAVTDFITLLVSGVLLLSTGLGAKAVVIAIAVGIVIFHPLLWWKLGRTLAEVTFTKWAWESLIPGMVPALACGSVLICLKWTMSPSSWFELGTMTFMGMIVYFVAIERSLRPADRTDLKNVFTRLLPSLQHDKKLDTVVTKPQ